MKCNKCKNSTVKRITNAALKQGIRGWARAMQGKNLG